jgi:hypothetical protein
VYFFPDSELQIGHSLWGIQRTSFFSGSKNQETQLGSLTLSGLLPSFLIQQHQEMDLAGVKNVG